MNEFSNMNRRKFLGTTAGAGISAGLSAYVHAAENAPKSERAPIRMAVMGVNGRGRGLLSGFAGFPEVEIAYICDPDADVIPAAIKIVEEKGKKTPKIQKDFRVALDDPEINVLVCAAPDHWHALSTILACQAGKDVYVEKPCSHNPLEGQRMIAAAKKYNRVVQVGTQRRSSVDFQSLVKVVQSGKLGKVPFARAWITSQRPNIGHVSPSAPPANLDFNLWAGPGSDKNYKKNLVHYNWHWRWDYGTGECGNNGVHYVDICRWAMGIDYPEKVTCAGGKYFFDDDQETPDTQLATYDFPGGAIQWEHRTWSPRGIENQGDGLAFYGNEATLVARTKGWSIFVKDKEVEKQEPHEYEKPHLQNFVDCVASREKPNADIENLHRSTLMCQLANIAWRTRSVLTFDGKTETIVGNEEATALMGRSYRKGFELPSIT